MADYHPKDEPVWETENFGFDNADNVWNVGDASMLDRENWGDDDFPNFDEFDDEGPGKFRAQKSLRKPSRLSSDLIKQMEHKAQQDTSRGPLNRPSKKLLQFQVKSDEESELEKAERLKSEREEYAKMVREQVAGRSAEERAKMEEMARQAMESEKQRKADEEKRRKRDEEFRLARQEVIAKRKRQEEALKAAQKSLEEEMHRKMKQGTEEELLARERELLEAERKLKEEQAALEKQDKESGYHRRPEMEDFELHQEGEQVTKSIKFIVNPEWGIPSLIQNGKPRILLQIRRLKHLTHAPVNVDLQQPCVLVVFSDCSFLCFREREHLALRLLFPPCDNGLVVSGPSLAKVWDHMFSLRFDDIGPFYFLAGTPAEAQHWIRTFSPKRNRIMLE